MPEVYLPPILRDRLKTADAAALIGLSVASLFRLARKHEIKPVKFGKDSFWSREDLKRIADARPLGIKLTDSAAKSDSEKLIEMARAILSVHAK